MGRSRVAASSSTARSAMASVDTMRWSTLASTSSTSASSAPRARRAPRVSNNFIARSRAQSSAGLASSTSTTTRAFAFPFDDFALAAFDDVPRDVAAAALTSLGAYAWVKAFDVLAERGTFASVTSRKLVHVTSGTLFACTWPLFSSSPSARWFAAAIPIAQGLRLFGIGSGLIQNASAVRAVSREGGREELLKGPLYYTACLATCCATYWRASPIGIVAVAMMCGGDGFADIIGRRFGKGNALPWNAEKSFAGSAGFVCGGFGAASALLAYFHLFGFIDVSASTYAATLVIATTCAIVESLPITSVVDDNFSVTACAIACGALLY